jgi:hypothetical protein
MVGDIKIGAVGEIIPERWATSRGISTLAGEKEFPDNSSSNI